MIERRFGWKSDPKDERDWVADKCGVLRGGSPPLEVVLDEFVEEIYDQETTSSCVAQSLAQSMRVTVRLATNKPSPRPSRRWLYTLARMQGGEPLVDDGTRLRDCLAAAKALGWCTEDVMPWSIWDIDQRPGPSAYRDAYDRRWVDGFYRIFELGDDLVEAVKIALSNAHPVVFGTPVDEAFCNWPDGSPWSMQGVKVGNHAMCAVGYNADGVRVANSWGRAWGDNGFGRISWSQFAFSAADVWVPTMIPGVG